MKEQIQEYNQHVTGILSDNDSGQDWGKLAADYLVKIEFYQHERFIHLIVTALFAMLECISLIAAVISGQIIISVLALAFLVLLIPYIGHYYFLENTVQKMYLVYDEIMKRT